MWAVSATRAEEEYDILRDIDAHTYTRIVSKHLMQNSYVFLPALPKKLDHPLTKL